MGTRTAPAGIRRPGNAPRTPTAPSPDVPRTGPNGKTSTARMIDWLLRPDGLRTGRYTSPDLETVRERISLDGQPIDEGRFVATYREVAPLAELVDGKQS